MKIISGTLGLGIKRKHLYEGVKPEKVVDFGSLKKVAIVSAVGGLNPNYNIGDIVILEDMISLFCPSSVKNFQNLSKPFDSELRQKAMSYCFLHDIPCHLGTYVFVKGPHYETNADLRILRGMGADVVGMSMVPEVMLANSKGIKVLGLCVVTDLAFGECSHSIVLKESKKMMPVIEKLVKSL